MEQDKEDIKKLIVGTFATKNIKFAVETSSLKDVHNIMRDFEISHVPICNGRGTPVGVIAGIDVRAFCLSTEFDELTADQIMHTNIMCFPPTALLSEVTKALVDNQQCAAIVKFDSPDMLGIFTVSDALKALNQIFQTIG